jgi:hypothetical protein
MNTFKIPGLGVAIAVGALFLAGCKKEVGKETAVEQLSFNNTSIFQFFNASIPNAATDPRKDYLYVDAKALTGAHVTYGSLFPSSSTGAAVLSGFRAFLIRDTLVATTQPQISFGETFQAGKSYTIFMYDTFTVAKQKTVESNIIIPDDTTARVRIANFIYHPTTVPGIDIYSVKRGSNIVTNLLPTQVTDFMPYASSFTSGFPLNDTLIVFENGTTNRLDTLVNFSPTRKRSYTLIFRGRWRTNEAGAAPNPRTLSSFANN